MPGLTAKLLPLPACIRPASMFACSLFLAVACFFFLSLSRLHADVLFCSPCCLVPPATPVPGAQSALSRSFNSSAAPLSRSLYGSCREVHGSQGSLLLFNACRAAGLRVSTSNAKGLAPSAQSPNPPPSLSPPQATLVSHPLELPCQTQIHRGAKIKTLDKVEGQH